MIPICINECPCLQVQVSACALIDKPSFDQMFFPVYDSSASSHLISCSGLATCPLFLITRLCSVIFFVLTFFPFHPTPLSSAGALTFTSSSYIKEISKSFIALSTCSLRPRKHRGQLILNSSSIHPNLYSL